MKYKRGDKVRLKDGRSVDILAIGDDDVKYNVTCYDGDNLVLINKKDISHHVIEEMIAQDETCYM
jgi:hypothetical protein